MVVTEKNINKIYRAIFLASTCLPAMQIAKADTPPERGQFSIKYLDYQDSQPGLKRISVKAPSMLIATPVAEEWLIQGSVTSDTVSGATPYYHSEKTSASYMSDERIGRNVRVTKYLPLSTITFAKSDSSEHDYTSNGYSVSGTISDETKNTTLNFGLGKKNDKVNVPFASVFDQSKQIMDGIFGLTQVLSPIDIAQANLTRSVGHGYFSDPYKFADQRPDRKTSTVALIRWNHHFIDSGNTARWSYRYYTDSFSIKSHTLGLEYVTHLADDLIFTPSMRLYSQNSAWFYVDAVNAPEPTLPTGQKFISQDQRLSAFGAMTYGFKIEKKLNKDYLVDFKYELYEQRNSWQLAGNGSPGIDPLRAKIVQVGVSFFF